MIYRDELQANLDTLYVFGDNYERRGLGGQAKEMRGEPNAVGVRTKMRASHDADAYMTDETLLQNISDIWEDFSLVIEHLENGGYVVYPLDGIGTGLANLHENAPKTLRFIQLFENWMEKSF
jgi:hypothetical protein